MRIFNMTLMIASGLVFIATKAQWLSSPELGYAFHAMLVESGDSNLPIAPIGVYDLILLSVSDSPERSQSFRVDVQGKMNLPLLRAPILAKGSKPDGPS
jgi:hypothetical protein